MGAIPWSAMSFATMPLVRPTEARDESTGVDEAVLPPRRVEWLSAVGWVGLRSEAKRCGRGGVLR